MPRSRKPTWINPGTNRKGYWRTIIDGIRYFNYEVPRDERPQIAGIPNRAWDWLRELEAAHKTSLTAQDVPPLSDLFRAYLAACQTDPEISAGQYRGLVSRARLFLKTTPKRVRERPARDYAPHELAAFFQAIKGDYTPHYIAGVGRTIRAAFRWGARPIAGRKPVRILPENPLAGYDFPRAPKSVRQFLEGAIVRRFLRWAWAQGRAKTGLDRRFDRVFVLMLWFQRLTGCRPGEACGLLWTDIKWTEGKIVIPKERQKTGKKTGKDRTIYLTPAVVRLLRRLRALPGGHPTHVFSHMRGRGAEARGHTSPIAGEPWPSGSAASAKVRTLRQLAIDAGVAGVSEIGPKKLVAYQNRHGYASDMIASGKSHEQAAVLLGNTAAVVASTYAHDIDARNAELAQEVARKRRS